MDLNTNKECAISESIVKVQSKLFPISPRKSTSDIFLNNWYLKAINNESINEENSVDPSIKGNDSNESFTKDCNCLNQPPRWPTECQVLEERVTHKTCTTNTVIEPYYVPTGKEVQPKPIGEDCGIVIYQYYPISAVNYFSRSTVGGSKYLLSTCPSPEDDCLRFDSRFESGNLAKAIKITNVYYELYLRTDLYTNRHMQWFYFRVTNMKKTNHYRFSIVNLMKDDSLYNEGMRPLMYSVKDTHIHSSGWRRCGANITYYCNENINPEDPEQIIFNTLTFTLEFPHDDDTVYLAHSYPYTYSDLQDYLKEMSIHPVKSAFTNTRLLCKTLAGNNVYYVTVTSPESNTSTKKRAIVITARVHPGETPASWMIKGMLDFITSDSRPAKELRDLFIFKIVPMLNPDGVIVGNNRCSLSGKDLNRQYRTVIRESYPSIWYTKLMLRRLMEECGVAMYCDLHAHSRKHNIFIYGCENRRNVELRLVEQVFPLMLHKNAAEKFSFEDCVFRIQRNKEGTGRVVMWMMGVYNSYTLEASFAGSTIGTRAENHFAIVDYEQMGKSFCQTLLDFYDNDPRKETLRTKIVVKLLQSGSNADEPANIILTDYSSDNGDTSTSTSENEDEGPIEQELVAPPSSPAMITKYRLEKKKNLRTIRKNSKSARMTRKPLQIYKTTLGLSLAKRKDNTREYSSSSNSDFNRSFNSSIKASNTRKKTKKDKNGNRRLRGNRSKENECVILQNSDEKNVSVLHILPEKHFDNIPLWQEHVHQNTRYALDNRKKVSLQLAEVQSKLMSLKNKLWFGLDDDDGYAPLSWTSSYLQQNASQETIRIKKIRRHIAGNDILKYSVNSRGKISTINEGERYKHPNQYHGQYKITNDRLKKKNLNEKDAITRKEHDIKLNLNCNETQKRKKRKKKIKKITLKPLS